MILRAAIAAFLGGALVATLTALVERSRIEYGNLALYGNGALAVLSVGAAIVLYLSWSSLLRRHAPIAALIAATVSLHLGIGLITPINAVLTGTFGAGALAGFLFSGLLFVVPTALLAALAAWAFLSGGLPLHPVALAILAIASLPLAGSVAPITIGLGTGVAIALAVRAGDGRRRALTTGAFVVFALVVSFGVPLLFSARR